MTAKIKFQIFEISENNGYHEGKTVPQKTAKATVYYAQKGDPDYIYGQVSGGSTVSLCTVNPNVFNEWFVGAILSCEITVEKAPA